MDSRGLLIPTVLISSLFGCTIPLNDTDLNYVNSDEVQRLIQQAEKGGGRRSLLLVDPRSEADFGVAHLPGAMNVAPIQHNQRISPEISGARTVVVYGDDPGDALARGMAKRLMEAGVQNVRLFAGGLAEWRAKARATEPVAPTTAAPAEGAEEPQSK